MNPSLRKREFLARCYFLFFNDWLVSRSQITLEHTINNAIVIEFYLSELTIKKRIILLISSVEK